MRTGSREGSRVTSAVSVPERYAALAVFLRPVFGCDFASAFIAAHRFRCAAAIRFRAAELTTRFLGGSGSEERGATAKAFLGGRPLLLTAVPPCSAAMAALILSRSAISNWTMCSVAIDTDRTTIQAQHPQQNMGRQKHVAKRH